MSKKRKVSRIEALFEIRKNWREVCQEDIVRGFLPCPNCLEAAVDKEPLKRAFICSKCGKEYADVISLYADLLNSKEDAEANLLARAEKHLNITIDEGKQLPTEEALELRQRLGAEETAEYIDRAREILNTPDAETALQSLGISTEAARICRAGYDPESGSIIIPTGKATYSEIWPPKGEEIPRQMPGENIFNLAAVSSNKPCFIVPETLDALTITEAGGAAVALNGYYNKDFSDLVSWKPEESQDNAKTFINTLKGKPLPRLILALKGYEKAAYLESECRRFNIPFIVEDDLAGEYGSVNEALRKDRQGFIDRVKNTEFDAARPDDIGTYLDRQFDTDINEFQDPVTIGFSKLEKELSGIYPGLYVLAAASSLGKTTFALQLADDIACYGREVIFFSLEQSKFEMVSKSLARFMYINDPGTAATSLQIRKGEVNRAAAMEARAVYTDHINGKLSMIEGNFSCNVQFIESYIRQYVRSNGIKPVVFIDYLQILATAEAGQTSKDGIRASVDLTTTALKRLSRELGLTIFVISSVNRANYETLISFDALKESGGIEYTADVVMGLQLQIVRKNDTFDQEGKKGEKHKMIEKAREANPREIELSCLKNRYGKSNFQVNFKYYPAHDYFEEC